MRMDTQLVAQYTIPSHVLEMTPAVRQDIDKELIHNMHSLREKRCAFLNVSQESTTLEDLMLSEKHYVHEGTTVFTLTANLYLLDTEKEKELNRHE